MASMLRLLVRTGTRRRRRAIIENTRAIWVERIGTAIKYKRNGVIVWTSAMSSTGAMIIDAGFNTPGASLVSVTCSFCTTSHTTLRRFEYDHAGRLLKVRHKLDAGSEIVLLQNQYNEIGQLVDKKLHSTNNGSTYKQSLDYRYNIRGWLTSMNNSQLTNDSGVTNNETGDLFGMELGYDNSIVTPNTGMYNGNISGMKWSTNLALGTIKDVGYNYTYDPMNRILGATYKKNTSGTWANSSNAFNESGYSYDLNGNITELTRNGASGSAMDNLTYNYGATGASSNRLLSVTDAADDNNGFKEFNTGSVDDYVYDANGNMVWDRNKGGTELLANGTFDGGAASWTVAGTTSRASFSTAGQVTFTTGAAGVSLTQANIVKPQAPHIVIIDVTRTTTVGNVTVTVGQTAVNVTNGVIVLSMTAGAGVNFSLTASSDFAGYVSNVSLKGLTAITYNYLNLPEQVSNAYNSTMWYVYDAGGRKLAQNVITGPPTALVQKNSDYVGEYFYENDTLKFISHEEGRIVMTGASAEYQYHLKDHLGNVRMTFTTQNSTDQATGTLEDANLTAEQSKFLRYSNARRVNAAIFDHTNGASAGYSERLNGSANEKYGIARSLSVMPGDTLKLEVYGKYVDSNTGNWTGGFTTLMGQIASGTGGVVVDGASYSSSTSSFPFSSAFGDGRGTGGPKAYLNWMVFDRNYNPIIAQSGYTRMSATPSEHGQDVAHEKLASPDIIIAQPGYVYVYLSNEETSPLEVYFDDFKVTQVKSPVVQTDDYYPFGLRYNSYARENSVPNKTKLFQGQEHIDDLGLNWDSFKWRNHMSDIGRFFNTDPLTEKYYYNSPYAFSENMVTSHVELEGLESADYPLKQEVQKVQEAVMPIVDEVTSTVGQAVDNAVNFVKGLEIKGQVKGTFSSGLQVAFQDKTGNGFVANGLSADIAKVDVQFNISVEGIQIEPNVTWVGEGGNYDFESEFSVTGNGVNGGVKNEFSVNDNNDITAWKLSASGSYKGVGGEASYDVLKSEGAVKNKYQAGVKAAIGLGVELSGDATISRKK